MREEEDSTVEWEERAYTHGVIRRFIELERSITRLLMKSVGQKGEKRWLRMEGVNYGDYTVNEME